MKTFKEMYGMTRNWNLQGGEKGGGGEGWGHWKKNPHRGRGTCMVLGLHVHKV